MATTVATNGSPSPLRTTQESIAYYKSQYEQLEAELADFQASSKELEAELERDVEAAEKRERGLKEKVEALGYEVEEWKTKHKQSKIEANAAQTKLQKEITKLREDHRTLQLRLRDIEVSNDDFERQARNTTSSLEDMENKYNQAIERGVMAEDEIKRGEQERESLRIELQRLKDELNDLNIEAEIRQGKLRSAEAAIQKLNRRPGMALDSSPMRPQSPHSERSLATTTSSPTVATPPAKSESSNVSETQTPPSPPTSDKSISHTAAKSEAPKPRHRPSLADTNITPRPSTITSRVPRKSLLSTRPSAADQTPLQARRTTTSRTQPTQRVGGLPASGSLHSLHGLMSKMKNLEQRVQSARSKLPAPTSTPPRASPRSDSSLGQTYIPATVTVRSSRKRTGGSNASSAQTPNYDRPSSRLSSSFTPNTDQPSSRLSFGFQGGSPLRESQSTRPVSRGMHSSRPPSRDPHSTRSSSRASLTSRQSISHLPSAASLSRPSSRQSITGTRTPMGNYAAATSASEARRPRSSIGGSSYASMHGHSASVSRLSNYGSSSSQFDIADEDESGEAAVTPTPSRRTTLAKDEGTGIPTPGMTHTKKRVSGVGTATTATTPGVHGRRISSGPGNGDMGPPPDRRPMTRKLSGVGETF